MKLIYFLKNGLDTPEDAANRVKLSAQGYRVYTSNGSVKQGFQDSCDAIYCAGDFPLVTKWAESEGIKVIKPEADKPKPTRARKPKPEPEE